MDFSLTEEQAELRELAARVFTEWVPVARLEQLEATAERFDRALWQELAATGLLGVTVPEDDGGLGFAMVELALVCEQLGRAVAPVPYVWTAVAAAALAAHGSEEQRRRLLPAVASGQAVLATPPPQCVTAAVDGDRLSATIVALPYGHVADAVVVPVGDRLFLLDPAGDGVTARHGQATTREVCTDLSVDAAPVEPLGDTGAAGWLWERATVALCAVQAGVTAAAVRLAADYTSARVQFGRPLSTFQAVAHKAADAYIDRANIRATALQAAWRLDTGRPATAQVLTAAWWAGEAGQRCVHAMQHIHGGIGADVTYPSHRYFLWGKQLELLLGAAPAVLARLDHTLRDLPAAGDALEVAPAH